MNKEKPLDGAILTLITTNLEADEISDWVIENMHKTSVRLQRKATETVSLEIYCDDTTDAELVLRAVEGFTFSGSSIREYAAEEWTESWKKHFKPLDIGNNLRVCPPWLAGESDRTEIVINPGLSFGTGNHFTTHFCLEQLDRFVPESGAKTMADIGTGTGVLAISALRLGVESAIGADFDPICVKQAAENAEFNGVGDKVEFFEHDITEGWPTAEGMNKFDIVCANIYSTLLMDNASTLLRITGRYLMLTGIREVELDSVAERFVQLGAKEIVRDCDDEWSGLVFGV